MAQVAFAQAVYIASEGIKLNVTLKVDKIIEKAFVALVQTTNGTAVGRLKCMEISLYVSF